MKGCERNLAMKKKKIKGWAWVLILMLFLIGGSILWWTVVRITAPFRRVDVEEVTGAEKIGPGKKIRIGTFNIAHGRGAVEGASNWSGSDEERSERLKEIGRLLSSHDLDLVILNEVDFDSSWSGRNDQVKVIEKELGKVSVIRQRNYDTGLPFFSLEFGNVILSRFQINAASSIFYPEVRWWEPLVLGRKDGVIATLPMEGDDELKVIAVHLETRNQEVREASLRVLLDQASGNEIMAGDFNATWQEGEESAIGMVQRDGRWQAAGGWDGKGAFKSYPALNPQLRLDWVFVPASWRALGAEVILTDLSDHGLLISEWMIE